MPIDTYQFAPTQNEQTAGSGQANDASAAPGYYRRPEFERMYQRDLTEQDFSDAVMSPEELEARRQLQEDSIDLNQDNEIDPSLFDSMNYDSPSERHAGNNTMAEVRDTHASSQSEVDYHSTFERLSSPQLSKLILDTGEYLSPLRRAEISASEK